MNIEDIPDKINKIIDVNKGWVLTGKRAESIKIQLQEVYDEIEEFMGLVKE